jgi:quinol-cytochrome oxidoreductase complex cytochrome b subunit
MFNILILLSFRGLIYGDYDLPIELNEPLLGCLLFIIALSIDA